MSTPLAPRPYQQGPNEPPPPSSPALQKSRKISTACGACKQRKTRCSGGTPCDACSARNTSCEYDAASDQRRKVANQRNVQELAQTQYDLSRARELLGGMIAVIHAGQTNATSDLVAAIRDGTSLSQLAAHIRNEVRSNFAIEQAFHNIDFTIDGPSELPSAQQILARLEERDQQPIQAQGADSESSGGMSQYSSNNQSLSR